MERGDFVVEGDLQIGPKEEFFLFLDGEHLGRLVLGHFGLPAERGYTDVGRVRITIERLQES